MGREVRKVPADWKHPVDELTGRHKPMFPSGRYDLEASQFLEKANTAGLQEAVDYFGGAPDVNDYMPTWTESECTHLMMYEDTSEGTPISPAFATPEELAQWLADTNASAFGGEGASYEAWLRIARGGWAPSMVFTPKNGCQSGVSAML